MGLDASILVHQKQQGLYAHSDRQSLKSSWKIRIPKQQTMDSMCLHQNQCISSFHFLYTWTDNPLHLKKAGISLPTLLPEVLYYQSQSLSCRNTLITSGSTPNESSDRRLYLSVTQTATMLPKSGPIAA